MSSSTKIKIGKKVAVICLFVLFSSLSINTYAQSSVWKVSKNGKHFYLGGTVHLLSADDYPLPKEFLSAYKNCDTLIFETDLDAAQRPEFQKKFLNSMVYSTNTTLKDELSSKTYLKLKQFLTSRNTHIDALKRFKPWAVVLNISVMEYQRLGMVAKHGVENYFHTRALKDNKLLESLETPDEQLNAIISMSKIEPNTLVNFTLRDLKKLPQLIDVLKNSWRKGDIKALNEHTLVIQMKHDFPKLYETLLTDRNNHWMKKLNTLNSNNKTEFVLVGAMHLSGKDGLLNQLAQAGFSVKQLK